MPKLKKKPLHRTVFEVVILSEEEYDGQSIRNIAYDITDGECSGAVNIKSKTVLKGKRAVDEIQKQYSSPEFFRMDEKGNELED